MALVRLAGFALMAAASSLVLAQAAPPPAPRPAASAPAPTDPRFTAEGFRHHVAFLADDLLEGRDAGTRGYDIAARYVATQFEGMGLKPANGTDWYQQVPFVEQTRGRADAGVTIGGRRFADGRDTFVSVAGKGAQSWQGDAVFVGYGLREPSLKIDDYAGLDVRGKLVVTVMGVPKGIPADVAASLAGRKAQMAEAAGAAGIITLIDPDTLKQYPVETIRSQMAQPTLGFANADGSPIRSTPGLRAQGYLLPEAAAALFAGARMTPAQVYAAADRGGPIRGFALTPPVEVQGGASWRSFTSPNVVGFIPGSDPALAGEYVLLMAHLDHNGTDPALPGADKIYNGAMDNATGVATMLEVARAFMASGRRPKRSLLFAAVTAEEDGLLGSDYLAKNPLPGRRVVSVVNLDMPILLYDFTDVTAFGAEHSTMGPLVAAAAARSGVKLSPDPVPEENLFVRSDHYSFVQQGVPSVFLVTGFANGGEAAFKRFLAGNYHKVTDDLNQPIDWQAGAKFARVNYDIARAIADAPEAPRWYRGNAYGDRYAPNAPKAPPPAGTR